MPRRVQDIVPNTHRSIREIPVERRSAPSRVPAPKRRPNEEVGEIEELDADKKSPVRIRRILVDPPTPSRRPPSKSLRLILATLGIIILVTGAGFVASEYFSRATFTIVPKTVPVTVDGTYVIPYAPAGASSTSLTYELITMEDTVSTVVPASGSQNVSTKAQGRMTIYNNYGTSPQQLVAGTRLANSSGKIYRLTSSISVPGRSSNGNPGSLTVTVVADQPGQTYNVTQSQVTDNFKIVAYKGTPRYDGFYAKLASDISGGFEGIRKTVSESTKASTTASLKISLTESLLERTKEAVPEGFVMYDSAFIMEFSDTTIGGEDESTAQMTLSGSINAVILRREALASRLAGNSAVSGFGKFAYVAPGMNELNFTITNLKDFSPERKNSIVARIKGDFKVEGDIPADEIKLKLAGVPLAQTQEILREYAPVIASGSGELIPPWAKVPDDPKRIFIEVERPGS